MNDQTLRPSDKFTSLSMLCKDLDIGFDAWESVTSTNDLMKDADLASGPHIIVSEEQTDGRGRMDRAFLSPKGKGLYLSLGFVMEPGYHLLESMIPFITMGSAVAATKAVQKISGKTPEIKWVNDLLLDNKKISGILSELQQSQSAKSPGRPVPAFVTGIGINCFPGHLPEDQAPGAGFITEDTSAFTIEELGCALVEELAPLCTLSAEEGFPRVLAEYRRYCTTPGKTVRVSNFSDPVLKAEALDIDENGGLEVRWLEGPNKGNVHVLRSGEISIR